MDEFLHGAPRRGGGQAQTPPASSQAHGDRCRAQLRAYQSPSLPRHELQDSTELEQGQGVCAIPHFAQVSIDGLSCSLQGELVPVTEKFPAPDVKADSGLGSRLPQLAQQLADPRRREWLDPARFAPIAQEGLCASVTELP